MATNDALIDAAIQETLKQITTSPRTHIPIALFEWWHFLIIIPLLTACIILIIKVIFNSGSIKAFNIFGFKGTQKQEKDAVNPHATCEFRYSLARTHLQLVAINMKIQEILSREILSQQMRRAEECILRIKDIAVKAASKTIKGVIEPGAAPIAEPDYINFKSTFKDFVAILKDKFRAACLNNGFVNMSETEYKNYMGDMHEGLDNMAQIFFEENLILTKVDQSVIFKDKDYQEKLGPMIDKLFADFTRISSENYARIKELEEERDLIAKTEWGLDYGLTIRTLTNEEDSKQAPIP